MGRRLKSTAYRDWTNYLMACRSGLAESLAEYLPTLYAYLAGECSQQFSELDRHTLDDLIRWAAARSDQNESANK